MIFLYFFSFLFSCLFLVFSVHATTISKEIPKKIPKEIEVLIHTKKCLTCHSIDKQNKPTNPTNPTIGPDFITAKTSAINRKVSAKNMADKIRNGGSGIYGVVPMPANTQLSKEEAMILGKWFTEKN